MINSAITKLKSRYVINTGAFMLGSIISQAISVFTLPVFTRYLTPEEFGIFFYTQSIQSILFAISTLSLNAFLIRHFFELRSNEERKELFGSIFIFIVFFNVILLYLAFLIFPFGIELFNIKVPFNPFFKLTLIINFLEILSVLPLVYYRTVKKAWHFLVLTLLKSILVMLASLIFVVKYDMGVLGKYYGYLLINILFSPVYLIIIFKISKLSFSTAILKKGFRFSLPLVPGAFFFAFNVALDRIMIERYLSVSELGVYSIGVALGSILIILVMGFQKTIAPEIYERYKNEDFNEWIVKIKDNFLAVLLILGCLNIIFAREFVQIIVAKSFHESYKVLPFLIIGCILRGPEIIVGITLLSLNKTIYRSLIIGSAITMNFFGNLILIPLFGIIGAAISTMSSYLIAYIVSAVITERFSLIKWNYLKDIVLIIACFGISYLIMTIQIFNVSLTIIIKLIISAVLLYFGYLQFSKHKKILFTD